MAVRTGDRVEFSMDDASEWRFRVVAANNEIVMTSEGYENLVDAQNTVTKFVRSGLPRYWKTRDGDWLKLA